MSTKTYVFLGTLLALLLISFVAANDQTQNEIKGDHEANQVADDQKYYNGGGWGGNGGGGWGGNGGGGWGGWGGRGGGGWGGWGGRGGGGWGGGGCNFGQCCGYYGGCRCCHSAQEALAYMKN